MNISLLTFFLLLPFYLFPQFRTMPSTSTSVGRGGVGISIVEPENLFSNMAAIKGDTSNHFLLGFQWMEGFPEVQELSFAFLKNKQNFSWGLEAFRMGSKDFATQYLGFSWIQSRGIATLGVKFKYVETGATELVVFHLFEWDVGTHVILSESIEVGLLANNLNRAIMKGSFSENLPLILTAGIQYRLYKKLNLGVELSKTEGFKHRLSFGWEYKIRDRLVMRSGVSSEPLRLQFGIGLGLSRFNFNYGMFSQPVFGNAHIWNFEYSY